MATLTRIRSNSPGAADRPGHDTRRYQANAKTAAAKRGPRNPNWKGTSAKTQAFHYWLNRNYLRSGICEECGTKSKTDYAFLRHPHPHTRERDDYRELCRPCHIAFDSDLRPKDERGRWASVH